MTASTLWWVAALALGFAGALSAFTFQQCGQYMTYIRYSHLIALIMRILVVSVIVGLVCLASRKTWRAGLVVAIFGASFCMASAIGNKVAWSWYTEMEHERLAFSMRGLYPAKEWLEKMDQCLAITDPRSRIIVSDISGVEATAPIPFGWKRGQCVSEVINELSKISPYLMKVQTEGNPWSKGPVHGSIIRVELHAQGDGEGDKVILNSNADPFRAP